jgi:IclR family transcriptional regulator, pca regulon regulatory protein
MTDEETNDEVGDRNYLRGLERGLTVMRAFNGQRNQLTPSDIARIVDLPRATVRRCLLTLATLGYVEQTGRYFQLTPQMLTLAQAYLSSSLLPRVAESVVEQVSEELNESCSVSILHGDSVIYVARSNRRRMASIHRSVGTHLPAYCTSMGRVLLAHLSEADLDAYFKRTTLEKFTAVTLTSEVKLRVVLKRVHRMGFSFIDSEMEHDLRAIAVPIQNSAGTVVAALHVGTQGSRVSEERMEKQFLPVLRRAASQMRLLLIA